MKKIQIYLLFRITLISAGLAVQNSSSRCPSPNTIHPCHCEYETLSINLVCENITYDDALTTAVTAMKTQVDSYYLLKFKLKSSFLRYLPGNLFEGARFKYIDISNSGVLDLSDGEYAFKGLEDSLLQFTVKNCTYINHWNWNHLKRLKQIGELKISQSNMLEISDDFIDGILKWPLQQLSLVENNIKRIPSKAFSKLEKLRGLDLDKNSLMSVERSLFPKPAKYLSYLSLRENGIRDLPIDMFQEMPVLTYLMLSGNPIMVLEAQTFEPVWNNLKLVSFGATLHCDCRLSWITSMPRKKQGNISARCRTPPRLRRRNPADLKKEDFKC